VITVKLAVPPVGYDQKMSRREITERERQVNNVDREPGSVVLGVTDSEIQPEVNMNVASKPDGAGAYCAAIVTMQIVVNWRTAVHLASELKPGSCMYDVVLKHENGHVEIDRKFHATGAHLIEDALRAMAAKVVVAATVEAGYAQLKQAASAALSGAIGRLNARLAGLQKVHDSPEEYAKPAKICGVAANNRALGG
jgi:hypothetical protein